jgi:glycosyltransferase involved in cell wall biosynthesis
MVGDKNGHMRILHVVGGMVRGGVETWLLHVLKHIDRSRYHMDFLVHTTQPCAYDDEVRALGSRIIPCMHPSRPWTYARNFKRALRRNGPYDIVHSHVFNYSGYALNLARQMSVDVRIAHSHNDDSYLKAQAGLLRRGYLGLMGRWINHNANLGLAGGRNAASALFGPNWEADQRWQTLYYGVDLSRFRDAVDPVKVRAELNIEPDAFVIGHVGRFVDVKNHVFLVEVAAEVARREPKTYLLLVGDGMLRPSIEQKIAQTGLANRNTVGPRPQTEIPRLMMGAMDVFVLPSISEGLPLVGIEAQAAGLPLILSDAITEELDQVKPLVQRKSLSQPVSAWADLVLAARGVRSQISQSQALALMKKSPFNIQTGVKRLEEIYSDFRLASNRQPIAS